MTFKETEELRRLATDLLVVSQRLTELLIRLPKKLGRVKEYYIECLIGSEWENYTLPKQPVRWDRALKHFRSACSKKERSLEGNRGIKALRLVALHESGDHITRLLYRMPKPK